MFPYEIRPIIPEKDAADSAVLVKTCFRPWLDRENLDYLKVLREEGEYAEQHPLLTRFSPFPFKLEGVVCRDRDGKLLGLINSYDFQLNGKDCSLLANICVDPAHRKEGIAGRMLTEIERILSAEGKNDLFLQARAEKPEVISFYRRRGFSVTDYRNTWVYPAGRSCPKPGTDMRLEPVPDADRQEFAARMRETYPDTVLWNLDCKKGLFQTGTAALAANWIGSPGSRFRRVVSGSGQVLAWSAYQKMKGFADILWFIPAKDLPDGSRVPVLRYLLMKFIRKKPVRLDTSAAAGTQVWKEAGFTHMHTLAWMWKNSR